MKPISQRSVNERYAGMPEPAEDPRVLYFGRFEEAVELVSKMQSARLRPKESVFRFADEALTSASGHLARMESAVEGIRENYDAMITSLETDLGPTDGPDYVANLVRLARLRDSLDDEIILHKATFAAAYNETVELFINFRPLAEGYLLLDERVVEEANADSLRCRRAQAELVADFQHGFAGRIRGARADHNRKALRAWGLLELVEAACAKAELFVDRIAKAQQRLEAEQVNGGYSDQLEQFERALRSERSGMNAHLEEFDRTVAEYCAFVADEDESTASEDPDEI